MCYNTRMVRHLYGHRTPEIGKGDFASGWIRGVRHLASKSARGSFWHRHDETSVVCCLRGEFTYELHGIPSVTLSSGHFLVIPAQVEHRHLKAVDPVGDRLEILLDTNATRAHGHSAFTRESCKSLHAEILKRALSPVKCDKCLTESCRELYELAGRTAKRLTPEELGLARILCQLILYKMACPAPLAKRIATCRFSDITAWIDARLTEKIDIDRLVAHIGYSRTQVFNMFRENTGLTPIDFIVRQRVKKACDLLESTDMPSCQIAAACGFSSASAFNAVFRRQTGTTPLAWRGTMREKTFQRGTITCKQA